METCTTHHIGIDNFSTEEQLIQQKTIETNASDIFTEPAKQLENKK